MENLLPAEERLVKKKRNPDAGEGDGGMELVDEGVDGLETVGKKADKNPEVDVDGAAHIKKELIVKLKAGRWKGRECEKEDQKDIEVNWEGSGEVRKKEAWDETKQGVREEEAWHET